MAWRAAEWRAAAADRARPPAPGETFRGPLYVTDSPGRRSVVGSRPGSVVARLAFFPLLSRLFSMRILLISLLALACAARPAAAQSNRATATASSRNQLALSESRPEANPRRMRLACAPLTGQVFEANGRPLLGATLLIKDTHQVYVTDSEGKFRITDVVYQGQQLTIGAAGYITQDVALEDCSLPRLVLAKDPTAHIRRNGRRAGQLIRLDGKSVDMK